MLKVTRAEKALDKLESLFKDFEVSIEDSSIDFGLMEEIQNAIDNFNKQILEDVEKLTKLKQKKDPETGAFTYKENFREKVSLLEVKVKEVEEKVKEVEIKAQEAEKALKNGEEQTLKKAIEEKLRLENEEKKRIEKENSERKRLMEEKQAAEEKEREKQRAEVQKKIESKNILNRFFLSLKHRVDTFTDSVKASVQTTELKDELDIAVDLLPTEKNERKALLTLLETFFDNITRSPDNEVYRRFNLENEKFKKDVLVKSGSLELLVCAGFELRFQQQYDPKVQDIKKSLFLRLDEPAITNHTAWKSWFDTIKAVQTRVLHEKEHL